MPLWKMLTLGIVLLPGLPTATQVQPQTPCSLRRVQEKPRRFVESVRQVVIAGPNGPVTVNPGTSYWVGVAFMGIDLASRLEQQCK
jgi:hypothetical protein